MNKLIIVRDENCIKCGKCAKVCPASILIQKQKGEAIRVEYVDTCIACGHCVDVCPTASVVHSDFPPEKLPISLYRTIPFRQAFAVCRNFFKISPFGICSLS